ncbi:hypothetical protein Q5P01_015838 [Channa striata]|uniref:Uncharacterized protein n=1 Tax=Channa striata TaxID=64152 RepID=A0AA88ME02_CHASR|nr:hypothetical protein Q5P01_015838 [Channa striata]
MLIYHQQVCGLTFDSEKFQLRVDPRSGVGAESLSQQDPEPLYSKQTSSRWRQNKRLEVVLPRANLLSGPGSPPAQEAPPGHPVRTALVSMERGFATKPS